MPQLDYATPARSASDWRQMLLVALPLAATALLMFIATTNGWDEPYGGFRWPDAIVQVGGSGLVIVAWIAWAIVAWSKRTVGLVLLAVLFWGVLCCWGAIELGVGYFYEPWNWAWSGGP